MTAWHRILRFRSDDRAQAMTEFVIVIPLILFVFYAMLQTMAVAKAAQLTNYAAFASARSYATSFSKFFGESNDANQAHDDAVARAKNTALLIMAPVSHAQAGEALNLWRPIRNSVKNMPRVVRNFYGIAEGYTTALIYRMKGFSVTVHGGHSSSKAVVAVEFDYLVPVAIPGLAEMWNYLNGIAPGDSMDLVFDLGAPFMNPGEISGALQSVLGALSTLEGLMGPGMFGGIQSSIDGILAGIYSSGFAGARHNVTIAAKSVCGFEPWSGTVRTDDIEPYCEGEFDESMQPCIDAAEANQDLVEKQAKECEEADQATKAYEKAVEDRIAAEQAYQSCPNQGNEYVMINGESVKKKCQSEWHAWQNAIQKESDAYKKAEKETDECEDAGKKVDDNIQTMEDACQPPV